MIILVLGSLSNVVGYQAVQSLNQKTINDEVDQKDLLFQTILDIANNKEIQRIIIKSQMSREGFFNSDVKFSILTTPVLTKNQLKHMYFVGLMPSKIISKLKIQTMLKQHLLNNQDIQKEITTVIEKDSTLKGEITQLSTFKCDCENDNATLWSFPVLCGVLYPLFMTLYIINLLHGFLYTFLVIIEIIGSLLNCFWSSG